MSTVYILFILDKDENIITAYPASTVEKAEEMAEALAIYSEMKWESYWIGETVMDIDIKEVLMKNKRVH